MAQAFNLQIQPTLKTKDTKIISGIAQFVENSEIMRYELERRSLRAAKEVAPERAGGLKKAIEISKSTPTGFTLGVSDSISSGKAAVRTTKTFTGVVNYSATPEKYRPKFLKKRKIEKPTRYKDDPDDFFNVLEKSSDEYAKEMGAYNKAVKDENNRINALLNQGYLKKYEVTKSFQKGKRYKEWRDGGSKIRANMQEFGYPYKTKYWGPYKPNPNAKKGPEGKGYLRLGQVLAAKSLRKDSVDYSVNVTDQEVIRYEKTIESEMVKAYTKLLAKYLRGQKLPAYYRGIDKLKQKAPIPERALAYGNVTNINLDVPLRFPETNYSWMSLGDKLKGVTNSLRGNRPFEPGFSFLIDD
jgi:hypothetical protein